MKNRQGLTIAALIVAIVGLSIGFAAFSNTLNISSTASVNPDASSLKVVFANNTDVNNLNTNPVQVFSASTGASGVAGTINNEAQNGPTLTGLKASFTAPNQSVVYKLNVVNAGKLKAYLTDIVFGTTGNPAKAVSCTVATKDSNNQDIPAAEQATDSLVQAACNGISISVKIGELDAKTQSGSLNNLELNVSAYKEVIITISYASGSAYVDGPMNVAFGDIEINAASVGAQSQGGNEPTPVTPTYSVGDTYTGDFISTTAGVITGYNGSGGSITIPDELPVVSISSSEFNISKCYLMMGSDGEEWCPEFQKKYNGQEYSLSSDGEATYEAAISYFLDSMYTVTNATPQTITEIGMGAFMSKGITSVTLPNSITTIASGAFYQNALTELDIPSSITTIGSSAFSENFDLTTVTVHNNEGAVNIGDNAFESTVTITYVGTGQ